MDYIRLKEIADNAGLSVRRYSGRGMYGSYCVGVDFESNRDIAYMIESCDDVDEAAQMFREMKQDNMGLGYIAYWPYVKWPDDVADPEMNDSDDED